MADSSGACLWETEFLLWSLLAFCVGCFTLTLSHLTLFPVLKEDSYIDPHAFSSSSSEDDGGESASDRSTSDTGSSSSSSALSTASSALTSSSELSQDSASTAPSEGKLPQRASVQPGQQYAPGTGAAPHEMVREDLHRVSSVSQNGEHRARAQRRRQPSQPLPSQQRDSLTYLAFCSLGLYFLSGAAYFVATLLVAAQNVPIVFLNPIVYVLWPINYLFFVRIRAAQNDPMLRPATVRLVTLAASVLLVTATLTIVAFYSGPFGIELLDECGE